MVAGGRRRHDRRSVDGAGRGRALHRRRHARDGEARHAASSASGRRRAPRTTGWSTGARVRLVFDRERRDVYGRLLAYVYVGRASSSTPSWFAAGYARTLAIAPNTAHGRALGGSAGGRPGRPRPVGRVLRRRRRPPVSVRDRTLTAAVAIRTRRLCRRSVRSLQPRAPPVAVLGHASSSFLARERLLDLRPHEDAADPHAVRARVRAGGRARAAPPQAASPARGQPLAARRIQRTEQRGKVAFGVLVVALTRHGRHRDRGDVRDAGLADGLARPARRRRLLSPASSAVQSLRARREPLDRLVGSRVVAHLLFLDREVDLLAEHRDVARAR